MAVYLNLSVKKCGWKGLPKIMYTQIPWLIMFTHGYPSLKKTPAQLKPVFTHL